MLNRFIINNWINELMHSKQYINKRRKAVMKFNIKWSHNIITMIDIKEINKDPATILIDNRLDKVKDWKTIEKDSNINKVIKKTSIRVKNKYNRYETRIKPK